MQEGVGAGGSRHRRLLVCDAAGIEGVQLLLLLLLLLLHLAHVPVVAARVPEILQEPSACKGGLMSRVNSERKP